MKLKPGVLSKSPTENYPEPVQPTKLANLPIQTPIRHPLSPAETGSRKLECAVSYLTIANRFGDANRKPGVVWPRFAIATNFPRFGGDVRNTTKEYSLARPARKIEKDRQLAILSKQNLFARERS